MSAPRPFPTPASGPPPFPRCRHPLWHPAALGLWGRQVWGQGLPSGALLVAYPALVGVLLGYWALALSGPHYPPLGTLGQLISPHWYRPALATGGMGDGGPYLLIALGGIGSLWALTQAMATLLGLLQGIWTYPHPPLLPRPWRWWRTALGLLLGTGLLGLGAWILVGMVAPGQLLAGVSTARVMQGLGWGVLWLLAAGLVAIGHGAIYHWSTDGRHSGRRSPPPLLPGSLLGAGVWAAMAALGRWGEGGWLNTVPHGSLALMIGGVLWLYGGILTLLAGAVLNRMAGDRRPPSQGRSRPPVPPPAFDSFTIRRPRR